MPVTIKDVFETFPGAKVVRVIPIPDTSKKDVSAKRGDGGNGKTSKDS